MASTSTTAGASVMTCCKRPMTPNQKKSRFECENCKAHIDVDDTKWWYLCESCQFYVWLNFTVVEGQGDEQRLICTTCREKEWSSGDEEGV